MPTDRLVEPSSRGRGAAAQDADKAVLAVLAGTPLATAAARIGLAASDLDDAVQLYQAAGRAALAAQTTLTGWHQVHIEFPDRTTAETVMAMQVGPRLLDAEAAGIIRSWWYIRKAPFWRLRFQTTRPADTQELVRRTLDRLAAQNLVTRWWPGIYEPETAVFGGATGIDIAHQLFHAESTAVLDYLRRHDAATPDPKLIGRRELSVLLCSDLMRATGQDWHEQGDIWHRVTLMRPVGSDVNLDRIAGTAQSIRRLLALDTSPETDLFGAAGPLTFARPWFTAFTAAGHTLARAAHDGTLGRGIRDVLAHHVIFHWNRLGLPDTAQAVLARAAVDSILGTAGGPIATPGEAPADVAGT